MPHKRKRGRYAGWFVEVPIELKAEFDRLYPGRRNKRLLTIAMIEWAIRVRPDFDLLAAKTAEEADEKLQLKTEEV